MRNVTITLDDDPLAWATAEAAGNGQSLSGYVADMLRARRDTASRVPDLAESLAILREFFEGPGWPGVAEDRPRRDELYDRPAVRPSLPKT